MKLTSLFAVVAFAGATVLLGCSGSSDNGTNSSSSDPTSPSSPSSPSAPPSSAVSACVAASVAICDRACGCSTDGKCYVVSESDAGASASLNFDNKQQCLNLYDLLGCSYGTDPSLDYPACETAVKAATCVDALGSTSGSKGLLFPSVCEDKKQ